MPHPIHLPVGRQTWTVDLPPEKHVPLRRTGAVGPTPVGSPRELVLAAMDAPGGVDAPVHRALTPDDRVAVVLDESLPHVAELLAGAVEHLTKSGLAAAQITVVTPPGGNGAWVEDLPDEFADVTLEAHDPADRKRIGYVATTKAGRRVYLNRTLVEADAVVVLTGRGFDATGGPTGGESAIFPALSDAETRAGPTPPGEAAEVAWLLGMPIYVQVIEGAGGRVAEVVVGLPSTVDEGAKRHEAHWKFTVPAAADLVVATVSGDPARTDFAALAQAAATAAQVVAPDGRIAVLATAGPDLGPGATFLRGLDDPTAAAKKLARRNPPDAAAATRWANAATRASLFVASGWAEDVVEDLFATPLASAAELQRLVDAAARVVVIPDAHKSRVDIG